MAISDRIEPALHHAMSLARGPATPPRLAQAMEHAVFPGGARVRPWLVLAVADACGGRAPRAAEAAAAAIEMLHCASLVHDDLPCFDDADTRRGRPSVHAAFGEQLAVLVGDGLIVGAFECVADGCQHAPRLMGPLMREVAAGVGSSQGIVAGQAWESESHTDLRAYHRSKTGALFVAAVRAGAVSAGGDPQRWTAVGERLGEAYQVADDIADAVGHHGDLGKPTGQDATLNRPSAVRQLGLVGAYARLDELCRSIQGAIPPCDARPMLAAKLSQLCARLFPARKTDPSGAYPAVDGRITAA